ncbi:protein LOW PHOTOSYNTHETIC EFFICIENCY 1, chloroplastic [Euphorbia lathyris]|uniref:protein LOW PHOTOSYNTHETIC EFFICIENCY 1, chloroplastic n=1 Tax=Euphorbia lathyris TaxID=212925 RepID=UPI0033139F4D
MQALSVWPNKGGLFVMPHLDSELGSTCFLISRRGNSGRFGTFMSSQFDIKSGFLSQSFKLKFINISEPRKGETVAFASALEQQEIGSQFHGGESSLDDELLEKKETDELYRIDSDSDNNINQEEDSDEKEKDTWVDVRALACSLHSAKTADDVEEVLNNIELPLKVYSSMIKGLGWDKKLDSAMALVHWLKRRKERGETTLGPNLFIYNSLLGVVKQCEQFDKTEEILLNMTQEGIAPNVVTYNTLMAIYVEQGEPSKALHILEEMHSKDFAPSAASYSTALQAFRQMEDGNGAVAFYADIKEKYLKGEIGQDSREGWEKELNKLENFTIRIAYQVMRRWLVRRANLSTDVLKLLINMDRAGLHPSREEYERLVWACTREDHYVVGKELYDRIRGRYSEISLSVCNHVIWLMGTAKKWWAALEIYEDLLDKGPSPNNMSTELVLSHFNILLTAARKRGIWRWGVRLLNKMEEKGLKPGSREWNAVLVACSKASETSAAVQIFRRMIEQGEKPTIVSYGALLSALEKGRLYDEAVRVWEHMLKVGIKPNVYAYTIMASVFSGLGKFKHVDAIINEMNSTGIEPTIITYNAIISGCAHNSRSSAAYEWFHRMKVQNMSPNKITYEMLIEALAKDGKPRLAYELYLRAQNEGLNLSAKVYDAVVDSSEVNGATIDISILGPRPPDKKQRVNIRKSLSEFCDIADVPRRSKPFKRKEVFPSQVDGV